MCLLIVAACGGNDTSGGGAAGTPATTTPATSGSAATAASAPKAGSSATGAAGSTTAANGGSKAPTTGTTTGASTGTSGMSASAAGSTGGKAGSAAGSGGAMMSAAGGSAAGMSGGTAGGSAGGSTGGGTLGGKLMYTGAFTMGMTIPTANMCPMAFGGAKGDNKSPPLSWTGGPAETKSFAVVLYDTGYKLVHWVLWDIPPTVNMLTEGEITSGYNVMNPMGAHQATAMGNDPHAYYGPCSSGAMASTYEYRLYALKQDKLMLTESSTAAQAQMAVEAAMADMVAWSGMPK